MPANPTTRESNSTEAEVVARLRDWLRAPDHDQVFTMEDLITWVNNRPIAEFERLAARVTALEAEKAGLVSALEEILTVHETGDDPFGIIEHVARQALSRSNTEVKNDGH